MEHRKNTNIVMEDNMGEYKIERSPAVALILIEWAKEDGSGKKYKKCHGK